MHSICAWIWFENEREWVMHRGRSGDRVEMEYESDSSRIIKEVYDREVEKQVEWREDRLWLTLSSSSRS